MTTPRAVWKGFLKFGAVSCTVKIIGAVSEAEKIRFNTLNRSTRNPVKSAYVDEATGEPVETEDQVKGYELDRGEFLLVDPDEIKELKPKSEHTLEIEDFVAIADIDSRYLEKPYYLVPGDKVSQEPYAAIREALKDKKVAARSCIVLYQRIRDVLIQPLGRGLLMTTMRTPDEMIDEASVFEDLGKIKVDKEMAEIAGLIIEKKPGKFDPEKFVDTYEEALAEMIEAKKEGKRMPKAAPKPRKTNVIHLADVLRKSLEKEGGKAPARKKSS